MPMSTTASHRLDVIDANTIGITADAANVRDDVNDRERNAKVFQIESVLFIQKVRQPKQIHPPDRIGQEFAYRKRPHLTMWKKSTPRDFHVRFRRIALNISQLSG